jgi:hypothetical protein
MLDSPLSPEEWLEMFQQDAISETSDVSDRDRPALIMEPVDFEEQLIAVEGLLRRNKAADAQLESERKEIIDFIKRSSGSAHERALDESGENFYAMVYQGAAHSMAALGMLAPMYESMFYHGFQGVRRRYFGLTVIPPNTRRPISDPDMFWDCHNCYDRETRAVKEQSLVGGIMQLAKAIGLKEHLPKGLPKTIEALFDYRNFMFHNGFEWPKERCAEFQEHIEKQGWQSWFSKATRGKAPWIFYMTDEFIDHCIGMIHKLLDAFGAYCKVQAPISVSAEWPCAE